MDTVLYSHLWKWSYGISERCMTHEDFAWPSNSVCFANMPSFVVRWSETTDTYILNRNFTLLWKNRGTLIGLYFLWSVAMILISRPANKNWPWLAKEILNIFECKSWASRKSLINYCWTFKATDLRSLVYGISLESPDRPLWQVY